MVVDDMSGFSLWYAVRKKGKPPARVSPLFGFAENSPLPALWKHRRISLTAVSDQGRCPWTPVPFFEKKGTQKAEIALRGLSSTGRSFCCYFSSSTNIKHPSSSNRKVWTSYRWFLMMSSIMMASVTVTTKVYATPCRLARPVRPMRWT